MTKIGIFGLTLIATLIAATTVHAQPSGSQPQLPFSWGMWQQLKDNPAEVNRLRSQLPPVAAPTAPRTEVPARAPAGAPLSPFSPEGAPVAGWTNLLNNPGVNLSNPMVLTDGTVIAHVSCTGTWYKLTPDINGSYVNGTWTQIALLPSGYTPRFFASAVLPDGRFIINGGEFNTNCNAQWTNLGAIYDPVANSWTSVAPPAGWTQIGDSQATVLANGTYMLADCCDAPGTKFAQLNASNLTWTNFEGAGKFDSFNEEGWTLLPDGTVLTVDAYVRTNVCGFNTERFNPATNTWSSAGSVPSQLPDCNATNTEGNFNPSFEMGPAALMYNGVAIAFGATTLNTAHTALFNTSTNTWSAGPDLPTTCNTGSTACTMPDAPAAVMPNGNVLIATSWGKFHTPTNFFEYSPSSNGFTAAPAMANAANVTSFQINFVVLPTGQILGVQTDNSTVQIYTPSGSFATQWQPTVTSVPTTLVAGGTYIVSGTQFAGLSEGAYYGDDVMASTNFPLMRIVNNSSQHVFYARTFNHSTRSVAANAAGSTSFKVPANIEPGASTLYVVANGIPSIGTAVCIPRVNSHDFNDDCESDVLWYNTTSGQAVVWLVSGTSVIGGGSPGSAASPWAIVGQRDFNGDGNADILWRNGTSGQLVVWLLNGGSVIGGGSPGSAASPWSVAGTADFNGDGFGDILWYNTSTGQVVIWLLNGTSVIGGGSPGSATSPWTIAGTGDFNGDGMSDILWYNTSTGQAVIWLMNSTSLIGGGSPGSAANPWTVAGTGDFNGDGNSDILWFNGTSGQAVIWLLNGTSLIGGGSPGSAASPWTIAETGDFNGDGKSDILWYNTGTGQLVEWLLSGASVIGGGSPGSAASPWQVQGLNAD